MDIMEESLKKHSIWRGKLEILSRVGVKTREELSLAYTPGVAKPCLEIKNNPEKSFELTRRWNTVAVITDGSAVLGLGDIGPLAGMPVMEGKCVLFKQFGDVDAIPLCVSTKKVDEFVNTVRLISKSFGGINLEDISAPRCFEIEKKLQEVCDIPVFHDDQHGTAIVVLAAVTNALKVVKKRFNECKICICGAGAAGTAIAKLLLTKKVTDIICCDKEGIIYRGRPKDNDALKDLANATNKQNKRGNLAEAIKDADIFVGVSTGGIVNADLVKTMAKDPIVMAMANPIPEIMPEEAKAAGAAVVGTGRGDYPNQINNVLAFPGIFRGALDARAKHINTHMHIASAEAIANLVSEEELNSQYILPQPFDERISKAVGLAVKQAWLDSNKKGKNN